MPLKAKLLTGLIALVCGSLIALIIMIQLALREMDRSHADFTDTGVGCTDDCLEPAISTKE